MSEEVIEKAERPSGFYYLDGLDRTMCDVLDEMRKCNKTRNYAPLSALIEEVQIMGSRMETKLRSYKAINEGDAYRKELRLEVEVLEKKREKLTSAVNDLEEKVGNA